MTDPPNREVAVFNAVRQLPPSERAAYLDQACAGDTGLRNRIEAFLQADEEAGSFLEKPASTSREAGPGGRGGTIAISPASEQPGERIGRYKVLQEIGEGGGGMVFMAQQEEPVKRRVALKVIKLGMDTKQVIGRFEAERQALALMDHPNIAKVLDAGATETGRPFFVMELVRGIKITDYCDQNKLGTAHRLKLFVQICHAVQHAHQKGIIHRDIKPSNILVTLHDGVPIPKVIDFGIAKATTDVQLTDKTMFTQFEQFIGTPAYMSPEQAEMSGLDIDTRTDIYSLGVLLYELLTGKTPFDAKELQSAGIEAMRKTIREKDPVRPSTRVGTLTGDDLTTTANRRGLEAPKLVSLLRGDLDWVVMKALEKDRTRRYETANGLAMEVQRYLDNEPVLARPPSKVYRFQKMVRRNKIAFVAATVTAAALLLGVAVSTWQAVRATRAEAATRRERDLATYARRQAEIMNRFLKVDLLEQATPDANAPEPMRLAMAAVLKRAASHLDQDREISGLPELEGKLRFALGSTYLKLGILDEAERNLHRAWERTRSALGANDPQTLVQQEQLAWLLVGYLKKFDDGEKLSYETWQTRRKVLSEEHPDTLDSMDTYGTALVNQKKLLEAEEIYRKCLAARERTLGPTNDATLTSLGNLGTLLQSRGDFAGAERIYHDVIERRRRLGLSETTDSFVNFGNLAMAQFLQDRTDEAITTLKDMLTRERRILDPDHPHVLQTQHILVRALGVAGHLDEAETLGRKTLESRRRTTPGHEGTGRTLMYLGRVLVEKNGTGEAESLLREAHALFLESYKNKPELAAEAANWLGAIQLSRGAYNEAANLLLPGIKSLLDPTASLSPTEQRTVIGHIVNLYEGWGKSEQASVWQKRRDALSPSPATAQAQK